MHTVPKILQSHPYGLRWRASPWFITLGTASLVQGVVLAEHLCCSWLVVGIGMCFGMSTLNFAVNHVFSRHHNRLLDIFHHHPNYAFSSKGSWILRNICACGISSIRLRAYMN